MDKLSLHDFSEICLVDFEFSAPAGERPTVVCMVAWELKSGRRHRVWQDELLGMDRPPFPIDNNSLFVAYYASAEINCHLALGWPRPAYVLDLFTEFRCKLNGLSPQCGFGLVGALAHHGLTSIDAVEKDAMRELAIRGGPWTEQEMKDLLDYCESDVESLDRLLKAMEPDIDLPRALLRGRYMQAAATMEFNGIPLDVEYFERLKSNWTDIQGRLIDEVDKDFGVYEGNSFRRDKFEAYLTRRDIPWPRLPSGTLDLQDSTFKDMSKSHPQLMPLRELRLSLSQMRLADLAIGTDGRNRCLLSAFRSRTGRNQPSNSAFIFGPSTWLRGLIKPEEGHGIAYIDWSQQEFGIAAALSGDPLMIAAYESGDPYLEFAKQAGAVPADATKASHKEERNLYKACVLAVQYGMGEHSLALRINRPVCVARRLLRMHRQTYRDYWRWSDGAVSHAMLKGKLWTVFGWTVHRGQSPNARFLQNFLMQANGAEMLRLACCMLTEAGVKVCAPIHDAVLIEAPVENLDDKVSQAQEIMSEASRIVLSGFRLRSDADVISYPDRYADERGYQMWQSVMSILADLEVEKSISCRDVAKAC